MATLWLNGGKIVIDGSGRPILCDTCPCCVDICTPSPKPNLIITLSSAPDANLDGAWPIESGGTFELSDPNYSWLGIENGDQVLWNDGTYEYIRQVQISCPGTAGYSGWSVKVQIARRSCCGSGDWNAWKEMVYRKTATEGTNCDAAGEYACHLYLDFNAGVFTCPSGDTMNVSVEVA